MTAALALAAGAVGGIVFGQVSNLGASNHGESTAFVAVQTQARVLDTREPDDVTGGNPLTADDTLQLKIAGVGGVPSDAAAVQLNVTVVDGNMPSYLTVWGQGDWPGTSSLNWNDGTARPNAVSTAIGDDGFIRLLNKFGVVHVVVDVVGYYTTAGIPSAFEVVLFEDPLMFSSVGDTAGNTASCPPGKLAIGGGASVVEDAGVIDLMASTARSDLTGWSGAQLGRCGSTPCARPA